jgi:hypothetical protein
MAYKDPSYTWFGGGCTVSNAAGLNGLFGNVSSLSLLNAGEVVLLMVSASGGDAQLQLGSTTTVVGAFRLAGGASNFDLPPMTVANASAIKFSREGANNPVIFWTMLTRTP